MDAGRGPEVPRAGRPVDVERAAGPGVRPRIVTPSRDGRARPDRSRRSSATGYERQWLGLGTAVNAIDGTVNGGAAAAMKYLTGYVVEKSMSVDNVFVTAMVFAWLVVPPVY